MGDPLGGLGAFLVVRYTAGSQEQARAPGYFLNFIERNAPRTVRYEMSEIVHKCVSTPLFFAFARSSLETFQCL